MCGNYDEAAKHFIAVLVREIIDSCRILKIGDYRAAKEILTKAINLMEKFGCEDKYTYGYCYYYLVEMCCNLEEYAQAEKIFEKSLELMSTSDFEFEIGMMYFRLKKYDHAVEYFREAVLQDWGSAPELRVTHCCEIYEQMYYIPCLKISGRESDGNSAKACPFLPDDNLCTLFEEHSNDELMDYLTKLIEKNPDAAENSELYNLRGQCYSCKSVELVDRFRDHQLYDGRTWYMAGEYFFETYPERYTYYKLAVADLKKAIKLNPACLRAYMNLAWLYRQADKPELVIKNYTKALKLCPYNSVAYFYVAGYLDNAQALQYYIKAYKYSNWEHCLHNIWFMRAKIASEAEFKALLKKRNKFIKKNPEHFNGYYKRGKMYYDFEKYELAVADFTRVIELKPNHGLAYFYRGECNKKLDNFIAAGKDFAKAEELGCKEQEVNF